MIHPAAVCEQMVVVASCGHRVGAVARLEGNLIRLSWDEQGFRGNYRYIPLAWVASVGESIYLKRSREEMQADWRKPRQRQAALG